MQDNVKHFREIVEYMAKLYERKNADYGDSFAKSVERMGYVAGAVRIDDKLNRVITLTKPGYEQKVNDESLLDTCIDGANYFIMLAMEIEKREGLTVGMNGAVKRVEE